MVKLEKTISIRMSGELYRAVCAALLRHNRDNPGNKLRFADYCREAIEDKVSKPEERPAEPEMRTDWEVEKLS